MKCQQVSDRGLQLIFEFLPRELEQLQLQNRQQIGYCAIPFGKYQGTLIKDVPLKYLDQTVSAMGATWFADAVRKYVQTCMHLLLSECEVKAEVPNMSWARLVTDVIQKRNPDFSPP
jgi:hypothetical protein